MFGGLRRWSRYEIRALRRVFVFHGDNSTIEKVVLLAVVITWVVLEIGTTFSAATPPGSMWWIRIVVAFVVGRMLGIERSLVEGQLPVTVDEMDGGAGGADSPPRRGDGADDGHNSETDGKESEQ